MAEALGGGYEGQTRVMCNQERLKSGETREWSLSGSLKGKRTFVSSAFLRGGG